MPLEAGLRRYADARVAALPPDPPAAFGPGSTAAPRQRQGRRAARPATRERGPAPRTPHACAVSPRGSALAGSPVRAHPPPPMGVDLPGHTRDPAVVAPTTRRKKMGLRPATCQTRPTTNTSHDPTARPAPGHREPPMGTPPRPRRTRRPRLPHRCIDRLEHPSHGRHRTHTPPARPDAEATAP